MEREVVLRSLVGSHNYNLNHEHSDKDFKAFVIPTFEDLYKGNMYSKQIIGVDEDVDTHDIRKLPNLLYKSNINFMEVLASTSYVYEDCSELNTIFYHKEEIFRMNLPYLYNACVGMHKQKMSMLGKGTEGTQHLVDKYGYDTKQALHAFRILKILVDYADSGFYGLEEVLKYENSLREFMFRILRGELTRGEFENMVRLYLEKHVLKLKEVYMNHPANENMKELLDNNIMSLVKRKLT